MPPTLQMLWENADPALTLRDRFGHEDGAAVQAWLGGVLSAQWDLQVEGCDRVVMSDHNALAWLRTATGPVLAKWSVASARFDRLRVVADVTAWLGDRGHPVSAPRRTCDGATYAEPRGALLGVQRIIAGDLLDVTRPVQVRNAGRVLAALHRDLAAYPGDVEGLAAQDPPALPDRITGWLGSAAAAHLPADIGEHLSGLLAEAPTTALPVQLVHGDIRSANLLTRGSDVVGVLDLEEMRRDHRVLELARSAVLLGTRFRDWGPVPPHVHDALRDGYEEVAPLTDSERRWWSVLVLWISLAMVPAGSDPTGWGDAALGLVDAAR